MREKESMKRLALALCLAALTAPALDAQDAPPAPRTGASAPADSGWTLVQATDWPTRAPGLIGKRVEVFGNLSVDPSSGFRTSGVMTGRIRHRIVATVSFDRISNEQVTWMTENNCLLTCRGVFVRGVVVIVGAGPVLQMIDISFESRAGGVAASMAALVPDTQAAPLARTGTSAPADSGWTLVLASEWRTRAPGLIGRRVELSGDLSTQFYVDPHDSFSNTGEMRGTSWRDPLATVLFDQVSTEQARWFRTNKCLETCVGVFVRGIVLSERPGRMCGAPPQPRCSETPPVLRMTDISFESRAGGVAVSMVQLDSAPGDTPAVEKQLLPPGGVPATLGPSAVTQIPLTPESDTGTVWQRMQAHSLIMRQRDLNMAKGMIQGPNRPADFETSYRSIRDTRLSKVFANYPWNVGRNEWPRVALVVEEEPTGGSGTLGSARGGQQIKDRCWRLRARLWTGPASSQDIAPFNWCLSEMRFNVSYNDVVFWGMTPKTSMIDQNTGPARTLGPNPPYLPAPRFHYANFWYSDTIMLGNILLDMSFDFGMRDNRVWIVQ